MVSSNVDEMNTRTLSFSFNMISQVIAATVMNTAIKFCSITNNPDHWADICRYHETEKKDCLKPIKLTIASPAPSRDRFIRINGDAFSYISETIRARSQAGIPTYTDISVMLCTNSSAAIKMAIVAKQ